ncbi:MAG: hypothetical protein L0958_05620, partial [Candidatus Mariimomonas ferrooxydans]
MISKAIRNASFLRHSIILLVGISVALLSVPSLTYSAVMDDYCITPPFVSGGGVSPNLLLMIDNSASMNDLQYIDDSVDAAYCYDNSYNNSKVCSITTTTDCTVDADCPVNETCTNQYAGYFDQDKNYEWKKIADRFSEKIGPLEAMCDYKTDYLCVDIGGLPLEVTKFEATGKFLNYLSSSKMDILKQILTGGKYDDTNDFLEAESRGCVGKRFVKAAPVADFSAGNGEITFGLRGTVEGDPDDPLLISRGGNTIIDIFEGAFNPDGCKKVIDELGNDPPNLGQIKDGIVECLETAGPVQFVRNSHGAFNNAVQICWYLDKFGVFPPGNPEQSVANQCEIIYNNFKAPGDIQPVEPAYVCSDRRRTCTTISPVRVCNEDADCQLPGDPLGETCDPSGETGFLGQCWTDNGNAWSGDGACEQAQLQNFCGELTVQEVIDPSDSPSDTGDFLNAPAMLIDSGLLSQLGNPVDSANVKIEEATAPSGLIHDYESIIRFGIMRFNYCGSDSETVVNPNIKLVCEDPDNPAEPNKDGSKIISYIGDRVCSITTSITCTGDSDCPAGETCVPDAINKINGIKASTWTPFAEAMYNSIAYYVKDATDNPLLPAADFTAVNGAIEVPINESPYFSTLPQPSLT